MRLFFLVILINVLALSAFGQDSLPPSEVEQVPIQKTLNSQDHREDSLGSVLVGYQLLTSWIPFKWSLGYSHIFNTKWSTELEWAHGSFGVGAFGFDAARIKEDRYSLVARYYPGNSFNFVFGVFKQDVYARLGSDIIDDMTNTSIDDFRVQGIGISLGLANRWQWENGFTLGVDWFRMNVPVFDKKVDSQVLNRIDDNNDISLVKDYIRKVKNVPTFLLFGIHLGYTF